eukprot:scaffold91958_cov48-Phaeocystis_antarctica.AAC.1
MLGGARPDEAGGVALCPEGLVAAAAVAVARRWQVARVLEDGVVVERARAEGDRHSEGDSFQGRAPPGRWAVGSGR